MATSIVISAQDVAAAANFLEAFLTDSIPEGDFGSGTALRDLTVGALAAIFAYQRADATQIRQLQSLMTVTAASGGDEESLRDSVTAILSNFFVTPKSGIKARGVALGFSSQQVDMFINPSHRFTRTSGIVFVVDSTEVFFIPKTDLVPIVDSTNAVLEYQFRIPLIATKVGSEYNIDPGLFSDFERFDPFVTRIENPERFAGGKGVETVSEILARAPNAISERNLINTRSIAAVLSDVFAEIKTILTVGMGDPEMQRDRLTAVAQNFAVHVGGAVDIYLTLDLTETFTTGVVGGLFARPDGVFNIFRDSSVSFAAVQVGDVIRITAGLPTVPREFKVVLNRTTELVTSERVPFPLASDEEIPPGNVAYTIGRVAPIYNNILAGVGGVPLLTGVTSRQTFQIGRITIPGGPVMDILDVAILNPALAEAAFKDASDSFVHFPNRVNATPLQTQTPAQGLQYRVIVNNPLEAQSAHQWMEIQVGTDTNPTRFDGFNLRIRYRTLAGFSAIHTYVTDRLQRIVSASQLCRGRFPVSLEIAIQYKLRADAANLLDDTEIARTVVNFINAYDASVAPIDTSAIQQLLRDVYPTIAAVLPFVIIYKLATPTGDELTYQTENEVRVEATKQTAGPVLDLLSLAVSDRTIQYLTNLLDVTATRII